MSTSWYFEVAKGNTPHISGRIVPTSVAAKPSNDNDDGKKKSPTADKSSSFRLAAGKTIPTQRLKQKRLPIPIRTETSNSTPRKRWELVLAPDGTPIDVSRSNAKTPNSTTSIAKDKVQNSVRQIDSHKPQEDAGRNFQETYNESSSGMLSDGANDGWDSLLADTDSSNKAMLFHGNSASQGDHFERETQLRTNFCDDQATPSAGQNHQERSRRRTVAVSTRSQDTAMTATNRAHEHHERHPQLLSPMDEESKMPENCATSDREEAPILRRSLRGRVPVNRLRMGANYAPYSETGGPRAASVTPTRVESTHQQNPVIQPTISAKDAPIFSTTPHGRHLCWEGKFKLLVAFKENYDTTRVPHNHPILGHWVRNQRRYYNQNELSQYKIQRLNSIGFIWRVDQGTKWTDMYHQLLSYQEKHDGSTIVPLKSTEFGKLAKWVRQQRYNYNQGKLSEEQITRLESTGIRLQRVDTWMETYERLVEYRSKYKTTRIPARYKADQKLANWVRYQRRYLKDMKKIALLNEIGFEWNVEQNDWQTMYNSLVAYKKKYGNTCVPREYPKLGQWVKNQRYFCKDNDRIDLLNEIGFDWGSRKHGKNSEVICLV